jgi:predicted GH43/DUF377 family glycosyl hydrolase
MTTPGTTPTPERLYGGRPIIAKEASHPWENRVTFNPACMLVEDRDELRRIISKLPFDEEVKKRLQGEPALCFLLYRAQGAKTPAFDASRSSLGLAVLTPELKLLARHTEPVVLPDQEYDNLGVEDGRLSKVGDRYVLLYTAYSSSSPENLIRIASASTTDFVRWEKHGLLQGSVNEIHNKNAVLFPEKVHGKYVMLHRPMQGQNAMCIHLAEAVELAGDWKSTGVVMKPRPRSGFTDTWIGGGAPPLRLPDGRYLLLYHIGNRKADGSREYDLGIAIADFSQPEIVVKRIEPLMIPETPAETQGDAELGVNNVLFVCGAYFYKGDLYFPYAGADSVVLGGKITGARLKRYLAG